MAGDFAQIDTEISHEMPQAWGIELKYWFKMIGAPNFKFAHNNSYKSTLMYIYCIVISGQQRMDVLRVLLSRLII